MRRRDRLFAACSAEEPSAIAELQQLVRQPSISMTGEGIGEMVRLLSGRLEAAGGLVDVLANGVPGNPVIRAEFPGDSERTLLFYNHYDVQPVTAPNRWTALPFGAEIREGKLYGRGASDDKAEIAARLAAIRAARAAGGGRLPCRVLFLIEGEEETGSPSLEPALARYGERFRADGCIWECGEVDRQGRPELCGGVKGMAYLDLKVVHAASDLHSSLGAVVENPAWRLAWALSTLKAPDGRVLVEGFYDGIIPPAASETVLAGRYPFDGPGLTSTYGIDWPLLAGSRADGARALLFEPTCTICGLEAGYTGPGSMTVLPREARAKIDCRLVPGQEPEAVRDAFVRHLGRRGFPDVAVELLGPVRAYRTDPGHPFVDLVVRTARAAWEAEPVYAPSAPWTGPMELFGRHLGLPIVSAGCSYFDSRVHAADEHIRLEDFARGIRHMALLLEEFSKV
jgi:acetylornithine deacetylase/succinyl-diaminopimelate desuccinylase-like protein